jgi:hypothetical protein
MTQDFTQADNPAKPGYVTGFLPTAVVGAFLAASQNVEPSGIIYLGAATLPPVVATTGLMMWMSERHDVVKVLKGLAAGTLASVVMMAGVGKYGGLPDPQPKNPSETTETSSIRVCPRFNVATGALVITDINSRTITMPSVCMPQPAPSEASAPAPAPAG